MNSYSFSVTKDLTTPVESIATTADQLDIQSDGSAITVSISNVHSPIEIDPLNVFTWHS